MRVAAESEAGEPVRGAWLVRGSSVQGYDLVPEWRRGGYCSLSAARLRELPVPASYADVEAAVQDGYGSASYNERQQKTAEFYAFLTRMRIDDIVMTVDGGEIFLGRITSPPGFTSSVNDRENLRRLVRWAEIEPPLEYGDPRLPAGLESVLSNPADVVDLAEFAEELAKLAWPTVAEPLAPTEWYRLPDEVSWLDELADAVTMDEEHIEEWVELLRDKPQLIFYGPPGTGKTYVAKELAKRLTGDRPENVRIVQFHPSYAYEDFFRGYRPVGGSTSGGAVFDLVDGPFGRLARDAGKNRTQPYVLIIDEINRANLATVFGELYILLEFRDLPIHLMQSSPNANKPETFTLPENIFILGTMNSADHSITQLDDAMRRRFWFAELRPDKPPVRGLLSRWLADRELPADAARLLDKLNEKIGDPDGMIGPSYFMRPNLHTNARGLARVWNHQIIPLLTDRHFGDGVDVDATYGLDALRAEPDEGASPDGLA